VTTVFVLALVGLTSLMAYVAGVRRLGLRGAGVRAAAGRMLECFGLVLVFSGLNLAVGFLGVLCLRSLTGRFISLYLNTDVSLVILSLVQAVVFQWWRATGVRGKGNK